MLSVLEMETSALKWLGMHNVSFSASSEHQKQLAIALARSKTLVEFVYPARVSSSFFDHYCVALSNNIETKLERLNLNNEAWPARGFVIDGDRSPLTGVEAVAAAKIRNLLKWNVQRTTSPPLFAAIGNAETDAERKQCLMEALKAVDIPVLFEYISANENNLIALIQRLGRSRKRHRED